MHFFPGLKEFIYELRRRNKQKYTALFNGSFLKLHVFKENVLKSEKKRSGYNGRFNSRSFYNYINFNSGDEAKQKENLERKKKILQKGVSSSNAKLGIKISDLNRKHKAVYLESVINENEGINRPTTIDKNALMSKEIPEGNFLLFVFYLITIVVINVFIFFLFLGLVDRTIVFVDPGTAVLMNVSIGRFVKVNKKIKFNGIYTTVSNQERLATLRSANRRENKSTDELIKELTIQSEDDVLQSKIRSFLDEERHFAEEKRQEKLNDDFRNADELRNNRQYQQNMKNRFYGTVRQKLLTLAVCMDLYFNDKVDKLSLEEVHNKEARQKVRNNLRLFVGRGSYGAGGGVGI